VYDTLETFKATSPIINTLHSLINAQNIKDRVKFYVHVYHFLINCFKVKSKAANVRLKFDKEIELVDVFGTNQRELFKPYHVFPPEELDVIVRDYMRMLGDSNDVK